MLTNISYSQIVRNPLAKEKTIVKYSVYMKKLQTPFLTPSSLYLINSFTIKS